MNPITNKSQIFIENTYSSQTNRAFNIKNNYSLSTYKILEGESSKSCFGKIWECIISFIRSIFCCSKSEVNQELSRKGFQFAEDFFEHKTDELVKRHGQPTDEGLLTVHLKFKDQEYSSSTTSGNKEELYGYAINSLRNIFSGLKSNTDKLLTDFWVLIGFSGTQADYRQFTTLTFEFDGENYTAKEENSIKLLSK